MEIQRSTNRFESSGEKTNKRCLGGILDQNRPNRPVADKIIKFTINNNLDGDPSHLTHSAKVTPQIGMSVVNTSFYLRISTAIGLQLS